MAAEMSSDNSSPYLCHLSGIALIYTYHPLFLVHSYNHGISIYYRFGDSHDLFYRLDLLFPGWDAFIFLLFTFLPIAYWERHGGKFLKPWRSENICFIGNEFKEGDNFLQNFKNMFLLSPCFKYSAEKSTVILILYR